LNQPEIPLSNLLSDAKSGQIPTPPRMGGEQLRAETPHEPVGAGMQEQPELVGRGLRALGAVSRQMRLPGFDMSFGLD
jgi:hypothetical protein